MKTRMYVPLFLFLSFFLSFFLFFFIYFVISRLFVQLARSFLRMFCESVPSSVTWEPAKAVIVNLQRFLKCDVQSESSHRYLLKTVEVGSFNLTLALFFISLLFLFILSPFSLHSLLSPFSILVSSQNFLTELALTVPSTPILWAHAYDYSARF
jgi:hypothetical protein